MKEIFWRAEVEGVGTVLSGQALAKVEAFEKLPYGRATESVLCRMDWKLGESQTALSKEMKYAQTALQWVGKMAQQAKAIATKPDLLSSVPCDGRREVTPAGCPLTSKCIPWRVRTSHMHVPLPHMRNK